MVALDPTRGGPTRTGFTRSARPEVRGPEVRGPGVRGPKFRGHIAAVALAIVGGFVVGICIANPGAAIIRDSLITLIAVVAVALTKRPVRSAPELRSPRRFRHRLLARGSR